MPFEALGAAEEVAVPGYFMSAKRERAPRISPDIRPFRSSTTFGAIHPHRLAPSAETFQLASKFWRPVLGNFYDPPALRGVVTFFPAPLTVLSTLPFPFTAVLDS
jgi:hypothetical protein